MSSMICIPRVDTKITRKYIFDKIKMLKWGKIEFIKEFNLKETGFKMIIIKLSWGEDDNALLYKDKIVNGSTIKVVHENPWYWRVIKYK